MSADSNQPSETSQDPQTQHGAPQPPPFNPMPSHANQQTALGSSVVPDLMKVYESMTQSKTPQGHGAPVADPTYQQQQTGGYEPYPQYPQMPHEQQQPQLHHGGYYPTPEYYAAPPGGSYQGTGPPVVPPVPDYPATTTAAPVMQGAAPVSEPAKRTVPDPPITSSANGGNGRSLRKRSLDKENAGDTTSSKGGSKTRKKGNNSDGRWSKRFTWPDDLHRDFVSAIFDVGLKHSSPSAIMEQMDKHESITSERIKSHLQKYRLHRAKSKKEFMTSYKTSVANFQAKGLSGTKSLASGEVAAHLTYSTMTGKEGDETQVGAKMEAAQPNPKPEPPKEDNSSKLTLPQLSEEEKKSPIGTSLGYLMGLFFSLRQQLMAQRAAQAAAQAAAVPKVGALITTSNKEVNHQVGAVYSHFAADGQQHHVHQQDTVTPVAPWQQSHGGHEGTPGATVHHQEVAAPSTRTNFEENKLMKQEMQNQMAFQNKMRDLKQRELNKYKSVPDSSGGHEKDIQPSDIDPTPYTAETAKKQEMDEANSKELDSSAMSRSQGSGEAAEAGDVTKGRPRSLSAATDDFWNTDVVDEQLFEFLMNP